MSTNHLTDNAVNYKDIPNHLGYRAGDDGSFWSCWKFVNHTGKYGLRAVIGSEWHQMKNIFSSLGYYFIRLNGKLYRSHRITLETFVGPCPPGMEARHLNGNKTDNRLCNLCWGTKLENEQDKIVHGVTLIGSDHPAALLDEQKVVEMRQLRSKGWSLKELSSRYGIKKSSVSAACLRVSWRHVP